MLTALIIAMLTAITVWWLLIQRLKDKPWMKQGVVPTSQETVTSSAPKVGLWVFLAVVSSLFGLFASAYMMRVGRPRRARVVAAARRAERAVDQHAASSCSRAARCRSRAIASTRDDFTGGRSYFLAGGRADARVPRRANARLAAGARGRQLRARQPRVHASSCC